MGSFGEIKEKNSDIMATIPAQEVLDGQIMDPTKTRKSYTLENISWKLWSFSTKITCTRQ